jgi:hypothetical protein
MRKILVTVFVLSILGLNAFAQSQSSPPSGQPKMILTGVVYDLRGSVIVNGTVVIAEGVDAKKHETSTNDEGVYKLELPLGLYKIKVSAPMFCPRQVENYIVVDSTYGKMSLDIVLESAASHAPSCKQEKIIEEQPKRKTRKKSRPVIIAIERKLNVRTDG